VKLCQLPGNGKLAVAENFKYGFDKVTNSVWRLIKNYSSRFRGKILDTFGAFSSFGGRNPSNTKRSRGRPDITRAREAQRPGNGDNVETALNSGSDNTICGIADTRCAGVGYNSDIISTGKTIDNRDGAMALIEVMIRDKRLFDIESGKKTSGMSCILASDDTYRGKAFNGARERSSRLPMGVETT
jgi:hypothetical protein